MPHPLGTSAPSCRPSAFWKWASRPWPPCPPSCLPWPCWRPHETIASPSSRPITTDSPQGVHAATLLQQIAETALGSTTNLSTIPGLTLDDAVGFRTRGLPALVQAFDAIVSDARAGGLEPIVSVGSGHCMSASASIGPRPGLVSKSAATGSTRLLAAMRTVRLQRPSALATIEPGLLAKRGPPDSPCGESVGVLGRAKCALAALGGGAARDPPCALHSVAAMGNRPQWHSSPRASAQSTPVL